MADPTPARRILAPEQIDSVANAVLALARELWVTRDRLIVLEAVLARRGIDISDEIDAFQPDAELQTQLDQSRDRLVAVMSDALNE